MDQSELATEVKNLRKKTKRNQHQAAAKAGVSLSTYKNFESGKHTTQVDTVEMVLNSFGYELLIAPLED